jgi:hypothetical protein
VTAASAAECPARLACLSVRTGGVDREQEKGLREEREERRERERERERSGAGPHPSAYREKSTPGPSV